MNEAYTESRIRKLCSQPRSLSYITERLCGVDPISVLDCLRRLEQENIVRQNEDLWLLEDKSQKEISDILDPSSYIYLKKYMGDFDTFKKPHPLDFEWRNTAHSINYLTDLVLNNSQIDDSILILGMPTLFANLCKRDINKKITIVERNQGVISSLKELSHDECKVIDADIFKIDPAKIGTFTTIIMDPPWYKAHFYQFIWVAARCLELGGKLIISIPPINTRPDIDQERVEWFDFCQKQGLCLENLYAGKLEYSMPFFEYNAMRTAGALTSPFWRRGDLAMFQKLAHKFVDRPPFEGETLQWSEIDINGTRFRINTEDKDNDNEIDIQPLTKHQILPSVSSRNPIRKMANVWTSGNRIFRVNNPVNFYTYLRHLSEDIKSQSVDFHKVTEFAKVITDFENEEYNTYLEWLYHEMEGRSN